MSAETIKAVGLENLRPLNYDLISYKLGRLPAEDILALRPRIATLTPENFDQVVNGALMKIEDIFGKSAQIA